MWINLSIKTFYSLLYRYTDEYCYSDKAIALLNQLNKRTQRIWYSNLNSLLNNDAMKKRVIILKNRNQHSLRDPRLAYFKVKIEMNPNFDSNDLKKFVKSILNFKSDEYWNQWKMEDLDVKSKKLSLINYDVLQKANHLNTILL